MTPFLFWLWVVNSLEGRAQGLIILVSGGPAGDQTWKCSQRIYFGRSEGRPAISSLGTRATSFGLRKPQDHTAGWASPKEKLLLRLGLAQ